MRRVSEHDTEEDISEESHYIEDEDGEEEEEDYNSSQNVSGENLNDTQDLSA